MIIERTTLTRIEKGLHELLNASTNNDISFPPFFEAVQHYIPLHTILPLELEVELFYVQVS